MVDLITLLKFANYFTVKSNLYKYGHIQMAKSKYKSMKGSTLRAMRFLKRIAQCNPNLFYYWQIGLLPTDWIT